MAQSENYVYASGSPWKLGGLKKRELARRAWRELLTDDVLGRAAQLAYFFLFALFPLGIFLSALLAAFAGPRSALAHRMTGDILRMIPAPASALVSKIIHESLVKAGNGKLVFGIVVALFSASSGMAAMMDTLNTVFDVSEARSVLRQRIVAVLLTVGLGALICAAMLLITVGHKIAGAIGSGVLDWIWEVLQYPVAILFLLLAFSMIYRFAPHIRGGHWRAFTPGAVTGLCLCIAASLALRVYLQHFNGYSDYGTIGAVMVLMLWFYATGLAFLIGGEIDAIIDRAGSGRMKHGGRQAAAPRRAA